MRYPAGPWSVKKPIMTLPHSYLDFLGRLPLWCGHSYECSAPTQPSCAPLPSVRPGAVGQSEDQEVEFL